MNSAAKWRLNSQLCEDARRLFNRSCEYCYSLNFSWLRRPVIEYPQDIVTMQELIWGIQPDLIIETDIAHGGSPIFSASMLAQLDMCDATEAGVSINLKESRHKVLGIDIRDHNRAVIEDHPMASRIQMIEGSSIAPEVVDQVKQVGSGYKRILVCMDSNHTQEHVLAELEAYAPLTSVDSYCVVFDTIIDDMPADIFADRPWGSVATTRPLSGNTSKPSPSSKLTKASSTSC